MLRCAVKVGVRDTTLFYLLFYGYYDYDDEGGVCSSAGMWLTLKMLIDFRREWLRGIS